ncbi:TldD/PmbA family protein [candidate division KSB1 bacterium]
MTEINRREFIKKGIGGTVLIMGSSFFFDMLKCGKAPDPNTVFGKYFGVTKEDMGKVLQVALSKGGEYSDLFFEYKISHGINMEEDIIKSTSENISLGVGVRVIKGEQTGYGYTNELTLEKMKSAAETAAAIASGSGKVWSADLTVQNLSSNFYPITEDFAAVDVADKIVMVEESAKAARSVSDKINQVNAFLADEMQYVTIATSEGKIVSDVRPQVRLGVIPRAVSDKGVDVAYATVGGRVGKEYFSGENSPASAGEQAGRNVMELLEADHAPAGEMTVVCGAGQSGVMVHEAVGHPLEADSNRKKQSIMHDKLNKKVATDIVTIYDDPTLPNYRGSMNVDDEGNEPKNAVLIENGILKDFIQDKMSCTVMNMPNNGHGRRQDYRYPAIPRMTNTAIANGEASPDDIIKSVKKGFYTKNFMGGQVFDNGKFVFSVSLGYLIENGKITKPVKNATLMGTNVQVLDNITMVGNDIEFKFLGVCGKDGQGVPVTCGTPTLKIEKMTVGGRS